MRFRPFVAQCLALATAAVLVGCSSLHPNLEPAVKQGDENLSIGGRPPAGDLAAARQNVLAYQNRYHMEEIALRKWMFHASDWSATGMTAGVFGGILKSPETALLGAIVGGAPTVLSDRYKVETQAGNFEIAANEMRCLHNKIAGRGDKEIDLDALNAQIAKVNHNLVSRQKIIKLLPPNLAAIQADMQKAIDARKNSGDVQLARSQMQVAFKAELDRRSKLRIEIEKLRTEQRTQYLKIHPDLVEMQITELFGGGRISRPYNTKASEDANLQSLAVDLNNRLSDLEKLNLDLAEYDAFQERLDQAAKDQLSAELATCVSPIA